MDPSAVVADVLLRAATLALEVPGSKEQLRGTGFLVAPGIVATCAHVVAERRDRLPAKVAGRFVAAGREVECEPVPEWYRRDGPGGLDLAFLRCPEAEDLPHVLLSTALATDDPLLTYGHPDGMFRSGQSATLRYEGPSRLPDWTALRVAGTPITAGYSGAPVLNRRSGAVGGMLVYSNERGSAHLVSAADLLAADPVVREVQADAAANADWLATLDDDQLRAGGWRYPGPRLRAYLYAAAKAAQQHPYPGVEHPPLMRVYVTRAARETGGGQVPAAAVVALDEDGVVVGGPGIGKSSLLRSALITTAQAWLRGGPGQVVPVRVLAADLVPERPLPEALAASVRTEVTAAGSLTDFPPSMFAGAPVPGVRWLVLVDGLDEVLDPDQRRAVIGKLSQVASEHNARYRFLLATRPLAPAELPATGWPPRRYELLPLSPDELEPFAQRWFTALGVDDPDAVAARFTDLVRREAIGELTRTPLLASMLCQLFILRPEQDLPSGRAGVYRAFADLLRSRQYDPATGIYPQLERAFNRFGPAAVAAAGRLADRFESLLGRLALARHDGNGDPFLDLLVGWTGELRPDHVPAAVWRAAIADLLRRSGLVMQQGEDFAFFHQTVMEYLAATHLVAGDPRRSDRLFRDVFHWRVFTDSDRWDKDQSLPPSRWRRPRDDSFVRFVIAIRPDRPGLVDALFKVALRGGWRGAAFVASLIEDGTAADPRLVAATADRLHDIAVNALDAARMPARQRPLFGLDGYDMAIRVLARIGDPRGRDQLAEVAAHDNPGGRKRSLEAALELRRLGDPRGEQRLWAMATNPESHRGARIDTAVELAVHGLSGAADLAIGYVRDPDYWPDDRLQAALRLHELGEPRARDLIAGLADHPQVNVRERDQALKVLAELGDERAIAPLFTLLRDHGVEDRLALLGRYRTPDAADRLSSLLSEFVVREDDSDYYRREKIRMAAAAILARRGDPRGLDWLAARAVAKPGPPWTTSDWLDPARLLAELDDERGRHQLLRAINGNEFSIYHQSRAAQVLTQLDDLRGIAYLIALATNPHYPKESLSAADFLATEPMNGPIADQLAAVAADTSAGHARYRLARRALTLLGDRRGYRGIRRTAIILAAWRDRGRPRYPWRRSVYDRFQRYP